MPTRAFQFLQGARPVALQQPRQHPIGEEPPARLTAGTVVRFAFGIHDALHRRATVGAGCAVTSVDRHAISERGDVLGESIACFPAQPVRPLDKDGSRGLKQPGGFVCREFLCESRR